MKGGVLSKSGLERVCTQLSGMWGVLVVPEPITEGGLLVKCGIGYKSARIHSKTGVWPSIPNGLEVLDSESIIYPDLTGGYTFLKALDGAPAWSRSEIADLENVWNCCTVVNQK